MKTYSERLLDYVQAHPYFDIDTVSERVLDKHKRALWKAQARIGKRIENMLTGQVPVFFLTLNYSDEYLPSKHEESSTQQHIEAFMSMHNIVHYVANSDYGKKNGRFHWHIVCASHEKFDIHAWPYGGGKFLKVRPASLPIKLSKYLIKLKRHATKVQDPLLLYWPYQFRAKGVNE